MIHNNLREASLLRAENSGPTLRSPQSSGFAKSFAYHDRRLPDVHLIHCKAPSGALEPAPRSSLSESVAGDAWDGFWSIGDERYYARRTHANGRQEWFRFAEEEVAIRRSREPRVLPLRKNGRLMSGARRTVLVGTRGSRAMLVGSSRRAPVRGGNR